jgi:hypothetical protein
MNCTQFKQHVAGFALAALDADDHAECQTHLADPGPHEGCVDALAHAKATAAQLGFALEPRRPPDRVWHAIERGIGLQPMEDIPRPRLLRQLAAWSMALLAVLLLLRTHSHALRLEEQLSRTGHALAKVRSHAEMMGRTLDDSRARTIDVEHKLAATLADQTAARQCSVIRERQSQQLSLQRDVLAMLERPTTKVVPLQAQEGKSGRASVVFSPEQGRAIVFASSLPERAGRAWQLWLMQNNVAISAGFLADPIDGMAMGEIAPSLLVYGTPEAIAISAEPAGGATRPGEVVVFGNLHELVASGKSPAHTGPR